MIFGASKRWQKLDTNIFWSTIAPCNHVMQLYESEEIFIEALTAFVKGGFESNECVIVIASKGHLKELNARLEKEFQKIDEQIDRDTYIPKNPKTLE